MNVTVSPGAVNGRVRVPASKSHTIRALVIAALAEGESRIDSPLDSSDTQSCAAVLRGLGVGIREERGPGGRLSALIVHGTGGQFAEPEAELDCGNSGTTFYLMLSVAALAGFAVTLTGDEQLRRRSAAPLLAGLEHLGVSVERGGAGDCAPVTVRGPLAGGSASVECPTSQYLSSLLLASPLAHGDVQITVPLLNERPYVEMTLDWLDSQGITVGRSGWDEFRIPGGQRYQPFSRSIDGDFSGATFLAVAAAITGSRIHLDGLSMADPQGDKEVMSILERMGCSVTAESRTVTITGPEGGVLSGGRLDLNAIPDALPALAVAGTCCREPLELTNVPQARQKETDRIAVMAGELGRLGAQVDELPDGLIVHPGGHTRAGGRRDVHGGTASSHGDHRVAMALAVAGLVAAEPVTVEGAECVAITYPGFFDALRQCGARVTVGGDAGTTGGA